MKKTTESIKNETPHPNFVNAVNLVIQRFKEPFLFIEFMSDLVNCYSESKIDRIIVSGVNENVVWVLHYFQNLFIKHWTVGDKNMIEKMALEMEMILDLQESAQTYYIMNRALAALALDKLNYGINRESHNRAMADMQTLFEAIFLVHQVEQERKKEESEKI